MQLQNWRLRQMLKKPVEQQRSLFMMRMNGTSGSYYFGRGPYLPLTCWNFVLRPLIVQILSSSYTSTQRQMVLMCWYLHVDVSCYQLKGDTNAPKVCLIWITNLCFTTSCTVFISFFFAKLRLTYRKRLNMTAFVECVQFSRWWRFSRCSRLLWCWIFSFKWVFDP